MSNKTGGITSPYFAGETTPLAERLAKAQEMAMNADNTTTSSTYNSNNAQQDVRQLILLGMVQDTKVIGGFEFKLRTLSSAEQDEVWMSLSFLDGQNKLLLIKKPILARSIVSINGTSLTTLYDKQKELPDVVKNIYVLGQWQDSLIDAVFEFYSTLAERSKQAFSEVSEEIKK